VSEAKSSSAQSCFVNLVFTIWHWLAFMCGLLLASSWIFMAGRLTGVSRMSLYENQLTEVSPEVGSKANLQEL
jgi:hypothetical protein